MGNGIAVFSGSANRSLAEEIARHLGVRLGNAELKRFSDGETFVKIHESVRGADAFVVQPTGPPSNETLMELLIFIDALKRASADRVTAVIPYFGYARQEKKLHAREPISAKLVANLLETAGAGRALCLDLHSGAIQGFFDIPADNLSAMNLLAQHFLEKRLEEPLVVAPDAGGVKRAKTFADILGADLAVVNKYRPRENVAETIGVLGDVRGKSCILVDDLIDTAGTLCAAAKTLRENGARSVLACATHGLFSGPAFQRLAESGIRELVVTNSVPQRADAPPNLVTLSVAPLLGEAIGRIHTGQSISELFKQANAKQTSLNT
jgi:ribose-phosphate pyrophosphokinase